tara:strand:+ start:47 stop:163 length:117 start_codon:yes stop_codon:yes gene_type:complete
VEVAAAVDLMVQAVEVEQEQEDLELIILLVVQGYLLAQ